MSNLTRWAWMLFLSLFIISIHAEEARRAPREYTGNDLQGGDVIACWQFTAGQEKLDSSGNKHSLQLRGKAQFTSEGLFGGGLLSTGGGASNDKAQGATAGRKPEFSPDGAFSVDLWFKPSPEMPEFASCYLIDNKYYNYSRDTVKANSGFMLYLARADEGKHTLNVGLGFEKDSVAAKSQLLTIVPGQWYHTAFSYDGAGVIRMFLDDEMVGKASFPKRGSIYPSEHSLVVGDRVASTYASFPGVIDQVRLIKGLRSEYDGRLEMSALPDRTVFYRYEEKATLALSVDNDTDIPVSGLQVKIHLLGKDFTVPVPGQLSRRESHSFRLPIDTSLKAGDYETQVTVTGTQNGKEVSATLNCQYSIVSRPTPFMPVVLWGTGDLPRMLDIGFTHDLRSMGTLNGTWEAQAPINQAGRSETTGVVNMLNRHMKAGMRVCVRVAPGSWVNKSQMDAEYRRIDRSGVQNNPDNAAVSHPRIKQFAYDFAAGIVQTYGHFPNLDAALVHTEVRDRTTLSFRDFEVASAREYLNGNDIPHLARGKGGVPYRLVPNFPASRIIPDDFELLRFYNWFWKYGDGWNPLHTQVHNGLKSTGRHDLWTFFDPAVRAPGVWGSGGEVDMISHWTYSYPDPLKVGKATDELFAMAEGTPGQQVMKMTQIIWYRSQTAPELPADEKDRVEWEKEIPDAKFISISPDHLSEALWSMISRPVRGIMYHGWASLVKASHNSYRLTNHETAPRLKKLIAEVIRPLGPTLLEVPDPKSDIALLECFSAQIFAARGGSGWSSGWEADVHLMLQWAGLQPQVVYEETIRKNGLDQYKVLIMPNCDVLTESVAKEIIAFQQRGGIVVADDRLCPGILADIVLPIVSRSKQADVDKAALQELAATFSNQLEPFYQRQVWTDNADLVLRQRRYGTSDYLFVINDKRTFGNYLGQHGLVMEKGLDNAGTIHLARTGSVYDLCSGQEVKTATTRGKMSFPISMGPGEGRLYLITDRALQKTTVSLPKQLTRPAAGAWLAADDVQQTAKLAAATMHPLEIKVTDARGKSPDAVIPLEVRIYDQEGQEAEHSGYYAAIKGNLTLQLQPAANDLPGNWRVVVTNLATKEKMEKIVPVK